MSDKWYPALMGIGTFMLVAGGSWGAVAPEPYALPGFVIALLGFMLMAKASRVYNTIWERRQESSKEEA